MNITQQLTEELHATLAGVTAAVKMLDEGATVPFIARYRKEKTGGLDDTQLRTLETRLNYLRELEARREVILKSISEQEKLTPELESAINACDNKTTLEDLYLPYRPKRRTRAQIARENGLQPLADDLLDLQPEDVSVIAKTYLSETIETAEIALDGARAILMEQFSEHAELLANLREKLWTQGKLQSKLIKDQHETGEKFQDYFDYLEPIRKIPSHRALALLRGQKDGILSLDLLYQEPDAVTLEKNMYEILIEKTFSIKPRCLWMQETARLTWRTKIFPSLELEALRTLKEKADIDAITVFSHNLKDLLLAAPAGRLVTLGLDPGFRNGVKTAVVDDTGKLLETSIIYPHPPQRQWDASIARLELMVKKHNVKLISIGNGTASRETDKLAHELIAKCSSNIHSLVVSEAGASVYSASELAAKEFPEIDVSLRGAISIARRLQDPLAELVKIDPKSIGVGQYQHDVNQMQLAQSLDKVIEDCVNAVGVDVNMASSALLSNIAGLNKSLADNIVTYREQHGAYQNRESLLSVPRLGAKTYEQAAGFLRIHGDEPLDASAVHPETYSLVSKMLAELGISAKQAIGNAKALKSINLQNYVTEEFGLPTLQDIIRELEKPGRDPRGIFETATFKEGVEKISDLTIGMALEGVVTNVANFGAFVDIGVHQDGLVHISQLSDNFVDNPHKVVKTGQVVKVRVIEIDAKRNRVSLSMKSEEAKKSDNHSAAINEEKAELKSQKQSKSSQHNKPQKAKEQKPKASPQTAMADAFAELRKKR